MFKSGIIYFGLCFILNFLVVNCTQDAPKVQLKHGGILVGHHMTTAKQQQIHAFRGIPYAKPPIGDLRFKSPEPFGAWEGEKLVVNDSNVCTQLNLVLGETNVQGDEDCLYLNVYVPENKSSEELPVFVWFHGGAFEFGTGMSTMYGPTYLLDRDIIYVAANYRLGPLGFLSTETLDCPGNFGLKDQVEVLKWVQENIAAFGGNPNSVTIGGESAGGASVSFHMLSDSSKGLFHKVIAQSGTAYCPWTYPTPEGVAAKKAQKVANLVGCNESDGDWANTMKCLRTKPAANIISTIPTFYEWHLNPVMPFAVTVEPSHDTAFLTQYPRDIEHPHGNNVPLLIGFNKDEGLLKSVTFFPNDILNDFKTNFDKLLPTVINFHHESPENQEKITKHVKEFYFKEGFNLDAKNFQNFTDFFSDSLFSQCTDELVRSRLNDGAQDTYIYLFKQKPAYSVASILTNSSKIYGVCHADELQYLFSMPDLFPKNIESKSDLEVREHLLDLWTNFVKTGKPTPNGTKLPNWPVATKYPYSYYRIGTYEEPNEKPLLEVEHNLYKERIDFWNDLIKDLTNHNKNEIK